VTSQALNGGGTQWSFLLLKAKQISNENDFYWHKTDKIAFYSDTESFLKAETIFLCFKNSSK
jgi:hypothetical protein